ncbi:Mob1/phocein, partial [Sphaerosporella brunnea]
MASTPSPTTSPRLPSPPPFTEVQIAPTSASSSAAPISPTKPAASSTASIRRIRPGTKSRNVDTGLPLTCLSELDSAFQLQEHLASLLSSITNPAGSDRTFPLTRADCERLATPPEGVEENLWCYELTRRLTRDLNVLIVALLHDKCTAATCPEMRASEWQYLCAVHDSPQSCCAIDYSTHTLDHAATMLTSTKYFPSRLSLHQASVKHLASIFRRLYRIFAHAWFQHRHVFWEVEGEYGLYLFFKTVSDRYRLIPQDSLMLPPEAEGL